VPKIIKIGHVSRSYSKNNKGTFLWTPVYMHYHMNEYVSLKHSHIMQLYDNV